MSSLERIANEKRTLDALALTCLREFLGRSGIGMSQVGKKREAGAICTSNHPIYTVVVNRPKSVS
ncbi:hypothetical protein ColLi_10725 [Colletotrichum liriopes]|uniref:Uncharacterized protein n=1 Tax=Colletotrichum liriopes TaxID=708192 RepID=A0AA37GX18_9PEZI|nr:hypothetical protein ColLi_10725 [Colletotrichum liriopes]